jgi:predicted N-formylglutamate amidohydrolase
MGDCIHEIEEAYEIYGYPREGRYLFSCEHATNRIPPPLEASQSDKEFLHTHWALDIGTRQLVQDLVHRTRSMGVMARFSRLVCDANRHKNRRDLILPDIDGTPLGFNSNVDEAEAVRRIETYHEPYHDGLDKAIRMRKENSSPFLFLSVHSFTPIWKSRMRTMDVGILFNDYSHLAEQLRRSFEEEGLFVAMNEPYSGKFGLMYAADRHGIGHGIQHIELEYNQSILCTAERVAAVAEKTERALAKVLLENE